jgi:hypothetical protein
MHLNVNNALLINNNMYMKNLMFEMSIKSN